MLDVRVSKFKVSLISVILVSIFSIQGAAIAGEPLNTVQGGVMKALETSAVDGVGRETILKDRTRKIINQIFDFYVISKYTLGKNWKQFSVGQQDEFVDLFKIIIENFYSDKLLSYSGEQISFTGEKMISETRAVVESKIITDRNALSVRYRMILRKNGWKAYDVVIEGVSIVRNYRSQFKALLETGSPHSVLKKLRDKAARYN